MDPIQVRNVIIGRQVVCPMTRASTDLSASMEMYRWRIERIQIGVRTLSHKLSVRMEGSNLILRASLCVRHAHMIVIVSYVMIVSFHS